MVTSDTISLINTTALQTVIRKEFGEEADANDIELQFTEFVSSGPGAYEDYSSWRQAWRDFMDFVSEDAEEERVDDTTETVIATFTVGIPVAVLTAEHQISLF